MKIKKQYIVIVLVFFFTLFFINSLVNKQIKEETITVMPFEEKHEDKSIDQKQFQQQEEPVKIKGNIPVLKSEEKIKIYLSVLGNEYKTEIKTKSSVYEAMKKIEEENINTFSFKYRETPGLGYFITEINNTKGKPGKYWIYYINGVEASVGVSNYILKEGDIIKWSQESL